MKLFALPLAAMCLTACSSLESVSRLSSFSNELVPQTKSLRIINVNGDITISSLSAHKELNVDVDYFAQATSIEKANSLINQLDLQFNYADGGVAIVEITGPTSNCGANLIVQIPENINLDIRNSNGDVNVVPLVSAVNVRTINGDVIINSSDKVRAKTNNGDIVLDGNSADFDLRSTNGDINLTQSAIFNGSGSMTTTNGSLRINNSATIDAKIAGSTTHGDYSVYGPPLFANQGAGLIRLSTINGNINITHVEMPDTVE